MCSIFPCPGLVGQPHLPDLGWKCGVDQLYRCCNPGLDPGRYHHEKPRKTISLLVMDGFRLPHPGTGLRHPGHADHRRLARREPAAYPGPLVVRGADVPGDRGRLHPGSVDTEVGPGQAKGQPAGAGRLGRRHGDLHHRRVSPGRQSGDRVDAGDHWCTAGNGCDHRVHPR